jgi:uncharacterized heparinase superfamily protein
VIRAPLATLQLVRPRADTLLFVPSDLRPADPSLIDELASGQMGLGGAVLDLAGSSPFAVLAPSAAWVRELNGFTWLGSLRASGVKEATEMARQLVADWCRRNRGRPGGRGLGAEPEVIARRVTAWVVNAGFLLEDAETAFYRTFTRTLGAELRALDAASRRARPGYPQLACLMALTLACLAVAGHDRDLPQTEARLFAQLKQQLLPDGGHVTRNPETVLDILVDLLPIRQCYAARGVWAPAALTEAIGQMLGHLRLAMLGAGTLARFNGVGSARDDVLATVLAVNGQPARPAGSSAPGASGYARLEQGLTAVVVDCGRPPPLAHAGGAHAGALSFEMSHGDGLIIVNRGAPGPAHREVRADSRATASHSTLALDEQSSSRLVRSRRLERLIGGPAIAGPDTVTASVTEADGEARLVAVHDGYLSRFGVLHERRLTLAYSGLLLAGTDILRPPTGTHRLLHDVPLAVRFHVPVEATIRAVSGGRLVIEPEKGAPWLLSAKGGRLAIEAGTDYAQAQGPSAARQAVIRAATPGETTIEWRLERA